MLERQVDEFDLNVARYPLAASAGDEPPRHGERRNGQYEPRQTEEQIGRHGAVPVAEQVLQGAPRYEGGPAAEQDQNDGRRNTHCTIYTLNRLPVASPRQTNNTAALRQGQAPGRQVSALSRRTRSSRAPARDRCLGQCCKCGGAALASTALPSSRSSTPTVRLPRLAQPASTDARRVLCGSAGGRGVEVGVGID
jgi:hypothetical protein